MALRKSAEREVDERNSVIMKLPVRNSVVRKLEVGKWAVQKLDLRKSYENKLFCVCLKGLPSTTSPHFISIHISSLSGSHFMATTSKSFSILDLGQALLHDQG